MQIPRIGFVTSSISRDAGGLFDAVRNLALCLPPDCLDIDIYSLRDSHSDMDAMQWRPLSLTLFNTFGPKSVGYAPALARTLIEKKSQILHSHGLWMAPSKAVSLARDRMKASHIISPHGMLDPWILQRSRLKKVMAWWGYEKQNLHGATCFHALNLEEANSIRKLGLRQPIAVIGNGVTLPTGDSSKPTEKPNWFIEDDNGKKILLYLGRLHPKKGVAELIEAWEAVSNRASFKEWVLIIAGWGDTEYCNRLNQRVFEASRSRRVSIRLVGPQFGRQKELTYRAATAVILPSFSEGLPMVPLEAWSYKIPTLLTENCNLSDGFNKGAAVKIFSDPRSLAESLIQLTETDETELNNMGQKGFKLVSEKYTWKKISEQMTVLYNWTLGGVAVNPDFIV